MIAITRESGVTIFIAKKATHYMIIMERMYQ